MSGQTSNYQIFALILIAVYVMFLSFEMPGPLPLLLSSCGHTYFILSDCLWVFYDSVDSPYIWNYFFSLLLVCVMLIWFLVHLEGPWKGPEFSLPWLWLAQSHCFLFRNVSLVLPAFKFSKQVQNLNIHVKSSLCVSVD